MHEDRAFLRRARALARRACALAVPRQAAWPATSTCVLQPARQAPGGAVRGASSTISTACRPTTVVVTGDLTNLSLRAGVRAGAPDPRPASRSGPRRVTVVPGNHDVYTCGRAARGSCSSGCSRPTRRPTARRARAFPLVRVRGDVAIVGHLDGAAVAAAVRRRLGGAARSWRALERGAGARSTDKFRIVRCTIRRTPTATPFLRGLRDRGALQEVLRARRLRAGAARPRAPRPARELRRARTGRSPSSASARAPTTTRAPSGARATTSTPSRVGGSSASRRACTIARLGRFAPAPVATQPTAPPPAA